jgi:hypothetical protein
VIDSVSRDTRTALEESTYINNEIDECIEMGHGTSLAHFWSFDAERLCLTSEALTGRALGVNDVVERAGAVEQRPHQAALRDIDVFDTAFALDELLVVPALAAVLRKEQGTARALTAVPVGMSELLGGMHAQAC